MLSSVTVETFRAEMAEALKAYDKYVVCLDKTPEQFEAILVSLLRKAIDVYENRAPELVPGNFTRRMRAPVTRSMT